MRCKDVAFTMDVANHNPISSICFKPGSITMDMALHGTKMKMTIRGGHALSQPEFLFCISNPAQFLFSVLMLGKKKVPIEVEKAEEQEAEQKAEEDEQG
ncbi:unnamed protein product [Cuscuta campestris]|uniref:Uncharacterized protein n=1 Tax=Cuscuta campestris TaxID=132261 RepID=A0A484LJG5_9ASTE|nr:unnamed protein product [Cuscuta campestris]